ncbi:MAG: amidohydrolase family protein [Slackia sp.]
MRKSSSRPSAHATQTYRRIRNGSSTAPGSQSAAFDRPYENGIQAPTYFTDEFIDSKIADLVSRGFAVSAHAIGETAIRQLTSAFEKADRQLERTSDDAMPNCMRYRIDHCEFPAPDTLERIYELKPSVTIQPGYSWMDKRFMRSYERMLDKDIYQPADSLRDFADAGVVLCGSSDAPGRPSTRLQMRGMREFYIEEQSLSAFEALATYTVNGGKMLEKT